MERTKTKWITNFLIPTSFRGLTELVNRLSFAARQAHFARNYEELTNYGNRLMELSPKTESLGRYYLTLAQSRYWSENREQVKTSLENLAESELSYIRAASLLTLGANRLLEGKADEQTAKLLIDSCSIALKEKHLLTFVQSQTNLSALCSLQGDHQQSLVILRGLRFTIGKIGDCYSFIKTDFYNNLAYESNQQGKVEEAKVYASYVLQSPDINIHSEWRDTAREIFVKKESGVIGNYHKPSRMPLGKLLKFPIRQSALDNGQIIFRYNSMDYHLRDLHPDNVAGLCDWVDAIKARSKRDKNSK